MYSDVIEHQTQPTPMGCVCTCLAMLMGRSVIDVIEQYHDSYFSEKSIDIVDILADNGFIFQREWADTVTTLLPGAVYVLTVPSLNIPGGLHMVLMDYRDPHNPRVLDPAKGYGTRKYYTCDTYEADSVDAAFLMFSWIIGYTITDRG